MNTRSIFGALLRRVGIACLVCYTLVGCGERVELVSRLSESDANAVMGVMLGARIDARKVSQKAGITVQVDKEQMQTAIELLEHYGLPRTPRARIGEVFRKENLVSSPLEERARYLYALSQELEDTLLNIDGVVAVRVQVVLPERAALGESVSPSSASVFVKHQADVSLEGLVPRISNLVSTSIPGLTDKKVSVVLVAARSVVGLHGEEANLRQVLFYQVQRDSAPGLIALLSLLSLALLIALAVAGWLGWRARASLSELAVSVLGRWRRRPT